MRDGRERCRKCSSPLSTQGTCPRLQCLPVTTKFTGKGTGRGNLNLLAEMRKAKTRCPPCREANNGRGCWPSVCDNGPYDARLGVSRSCDCHTLLGRRQKTSIHLPTPTLIGKSFSQWGGPTTIL